MHFLIDSHHLLYECVDSSLVRHFYFDEVIDLLATEPIDADEATWYLPVADLFCTVSELIV